MTEQQLRTIIAEAFEYANVLAMRDETLMSMFLEGQEDIDFKTLEMDSLARMNLCIAIEDNAGVTIVPEDLQKIGTLNRLVRTVKAKAK